MSLDVALDIIGTLRMMKIDEISEEKDENKKELLYKELDILTTEEEVANGLLKFLKKYAYLSWIVDTN